MRPNDQEGLRIEGVAICRFGGPYLILSQRRTWGGSAINDLW